MAKEKIYLSPFKKGDYAFIKKMREKMQKGEENADKDQDQEESGKSDTERRKK